MNNISKGRLQKKNLKKSDNYHFRGGGVSEGHLSLFFWSKLNENTFHPSVILGVTKIYSLHEKTWHSPSFKLS